jgi:hypothetical protein
MPTVVKPTRRVVPPLMPAPAKKASPKTRVQPKVQARAATRTSTRRQAKPPQAAPTPRVAEVPATWDGLAGKPATSRKRERQPGLVDTVPTLRFALMLAVACTALTLYVGHLYSTQNLVNEVQELRREKLRLVMQQNRLRGEFDRMTAPAVILARAEALGLRASADYAHPIVVGAKR